MKRQQDSDQNQIQNQVEPKLPSSQERSSKKNEKRQQKQQQHRMNNTSSQLSSNLLQKQQKIKLQQRVQRQSSNTSSQNQSLQPQKRTYKFIQKLATKQHQLLRHFIFQLIGTFILSLGIALTQYIPPLRNKVPNPFHNFTISLSLYLAICFCAPFSPAHFNPSVSLGFYFKQLFSTKKGKRKNKNENEKQKELKQKPKNFKKLLVYIAGQFIGSSIGLLLSYLIYDSVIGPYNDSPTFLVLLPDFVGQIIGTFFFVFFIFMVTTQLTTFINQDSWVHFFIPLALYCGRTFSFHVSGLNPAIVIIAQIVKMMRTSQATWSGLLAAIFVSVGSLIGGALAAWFFQRFHIRAVKSWKFEGGV